MGKLYYDTQPLIEGRFEANEFSLIGIRGFFVKFEVNGT